MTPAAVPDLRPLRRLTAATDGSKQPGQPKVVAVLVLDNVVPFDLSVPCEVFKRVVLPSGQPGYEVRVCGAGSQPRTVRAGLFDLCPDWSIDGLAGADTVIVPGTDPLGPIPPAVLDALRAASAAGTRIVSICSGAFVLAAAGMLDGLRATTHWVAADELARRYPHVEVDPDVLYVDNGPVLTSAGAAAGLDLCLHVVRLDHGAAVAADAARLSVMALERSGGQSQFIRHAPPVPDGASLEQLLHWLEKHLGEPVTVRDMARHAALSERTLGRRFREQTGTTPTQWLLRARVIRAQHLLEATDQPIERIAAEAGFGSAITFRARFREQVGVSPLQYRRNFRRRDPGLPGQQASRQPAPARLHRRRPEAR
jgi:transcriptional regulator GlxA family with amidase domain